MKRLLPCLLALGLAACTPRADENAAPADSSMMTTPAQTVATATLNPTTGNSASGQITFTQEGSSVRIQGTVMGLTPGDHGFHVHENGDCSDADTPDDPDTDPNPAGAAGGHFAPEGSPHGAPTNDAASRHTGDLGNITAGDDGTATVDMTDAIITLDGPNSIVGKAVIVHSGADDLTSQPSGAAGSRVACGVIMMGGAGTPDANMGGAGATGTLPDPSM